MKIIKTVMQFFQLALSILICIQLSACNNTDTQKGPADTVRNSSADTAKIKTQTDSLPVARPTDTIDSRKVIYLSFDDGPNTGTKTVLDVLKNQEVPATFFIIGLHVYGSGSQKKIWHTLQNTPNILLSNHSYTHGLRNRYEYFYNHPDTVVKDFRRNYDSLHFNNQISRTPGSNIWRLPHAQGNYYKRTNAAADALEKAGFQLVGWDCEWTYNKHLDLLKTPDQLVTEIDGMFKQNRTKIPGHLVLLAHDHTFNTPNDSTSLEDFVRKIKSSGVYRFALLNEYPGVK